MKKPISPEFPARLGRTFSNSSYHSSVARKGPETQIPSTPVLTSLRRSDRRSNKSCIFSACYLNAQEALPAWPLAIPTALALISHGIPKGSVRLRWKSAIRADFQQITLCSRHDKKCLAPRVIQIAPVGRDFLTPSGRWLACPSHTLVGL